MSRTDLQEVERDELLVIPSVFDALTAKLAEESALKGHSSRFLARIAALLDDLSDAAVVVVYVRKDVPDAFSQVRVAVDHLDVHDLVYTLC